MRENKTTPTTFNELIYRLFSNKYLNTDINQSKTERCIEIKVGQVEVGKIVFNPSNLRKSIYDRIKELSMTEGNYVSKEQELEYRETVELLCGLNLNPKQVEELHRDLYIYITPFLVDAVYKYILKYCNSGRNDIDYLIKKGLYTLPKLTKFLAAIYNDQDLHSLFTAGAFDKFINSINKYLNLKYGGSKHQKDLLDKWGEPDKYRYLFPYMIELELVHNLAMNLRKKLRDRGSSLLEELEGKEQHLANLIYYSQRSSKPIEIACEYLAEIYQLNLSPGTLRKYHDRIKKQSSHQIYKFFKFMYRLSRRITNTITLPQKHLILEYW